MKKTIRTTITLLVTLVLAVSLAGCATVLIQAPSGKNIQLATGTAPTDFAKEKRVWYLLWGLVPISDNTTNDLLASAPVNSKVYVKAEMTPLDAIISLLLGAFTVHTQTVSVSISQ